MTCRLTNGRRRELTHPVVALAVFGGSSYVLYLSGLFDSVLEERWAHGAMTGYFLLAGCLFYWAVIGSDHNPTPLPLPTRIGMVLAAVPFHVLFGIVLISMDTVIGHEYFRSLALPWVGDLLTNQRLAGGLAWVLGTIPLLVVLTALLTQWARSDSSDAAAASRLA